MTHNPMKVLVFRVERRLPVMRKKLENPNIQSGATPLTSQTPIASTSPIIQPASNLFDTTTKLYALKDTSVNAHNLRR
jgi:hypothetical protein